MPDRVVLGKADANSNPYYHRSNRFGLFVSKPGANVHNCSDGDLIFDSLDYGMFQTIGDGYLKIPQAKYNFGLFGEKGVITEANWNSNQDIPELNSDTSWLFDALKYLQTDLNDAIEGLYEDPIVYFLLANPAGGFATKTVPLNIDPGAIRASVNNPDGFATQLRNIATEGNYADLKTYVRYGEVIADELLSIGDISSETFVKTMIRDIWRLYDVFPFLAENDGLFAGTYNFPTLMGSKYVNESIDQDISSFLPPPDRFTLRAGPRNFDEIVKLKSDRIFSELTNDPNKIINTTSPSYSWSTYYQNLWNNNISSYKDTYNQKTAYNLTAGNLINGSAYRITPTYWRAWTVNGGSAFTEKQEVAAIAKWVKYVYIINLLTNNFGTSVNEGLVGANKPLLANIRISDSVVGSTTIFQSDSAFNSFGILDKAVPLSVTNDDYTLRAGANPTQGNLYNRRSGGDTLLLSDDPSRNGVYLFCAKTKCPSTKTWQQIQSELNISNYSYSYWQDGEATYDTGIPSPNGTNPVHVWWNPIAKTVSGSTTNLPILNLRANRIKESTSKKRGVSLRPGLAAIQANTYVQNNRMYVKFVQPSTLDDTEVYFKIYKEVMSIAGAALQSISPGTPEIPASIGVVVGGAVGKIDETDTANAYGESVTIFNQPKGVRSFIFDIRHTSEGGNSIVNRKSSDGRYYTSVFPDDFVGTKFSNTDPFILYRNSSGKIDYPLNITLRIPAGTVLSGNSFHNHITWDELQRTGTTTAPYGPKDTAGRVSRSIYACVDPCIKLNMNSGEFSNNALKAFFVSIENYGTMIGAGGWGQYGQMYFDATKYQTAYPGGGGGGGAGYHPQLASENPKVDWLGADGITAEDRLDGNGDPIFVGGVNTTEEIALAQTAVLTHWNGPNNYVEWGIGYLARAETYYTGLDEITWNSIGPGKPGTGYMGATETYHTSLDSLTNRPYGFSEERWSNNQFGVITDTNIYERLPGTFSVQTGNTRYFIDGWGNPGTYGSTTIGGKGGGEKSVLTFGYPQFTPFGSSNVIDTFSGSGGSCVYVYSNTAQETSGLSVRVTNYDGGIMKAGGGGGSGGIGVSGLGGGKLGRPGSYIKFSLYPNVLAESGKEDVWSQYSRRGEPGRVVWWNAPNAANNYYIRNYSTTTTGSIEGMEYNSTIGSDDYVSYLPNVSITQSGTTFNLYGRRLFSRLLVNGQIQYHEMQERTYDDYINQTSGKEFV